MRYLVTTAALVLVAACSESPGRGGDAEPADLSDSAGGDLTGDAASDPLADGAPDADAAGDEATDPDAADAPDASDDADGDEPPPDTAEDVGADASYGCVADPLLGASLWPPAETLQDAATLELEVVDTSQTVVGLVAVSVTELRYTSWQVVDCTLEPVRIEAFYAVPTSLQGGGPDAAIVVAHGLGGCADAEGAAQRAARFGLAALYYTGPGNCGSTGRGNDDPGALFDTIPDPRGSWFWSHAVAGSRAITVLETYAETDPGHLGMIGYSAGSLATLNVNGFDDRLVAVVPVSGVGGLGPAAEAGGWENALLESAGLTAEAAEWAVLLETVDPLNQAPTQHGAVLLVNGTQDEFFPLDSTLATFDALPGDAHRLVLIPNWDHGQFAVDVGGIGFCGAFDNSEVAEARVEAATAFWLGHHLTGAARFAELPAMPSAELFDVAGLLGVSGTLDTGYRVVEAHAYLSVDDAYTFWGIALDERTGDQWYDVDSLVPWTSANPDSAVFFTEFRLRAGLLGLNDFWITSRASLPPGFRPEIRPIDPSECL